MIKYIFLPLAFIFLASCEKAIGVDLESAAPKLVVDAAINWEKGSDGHEQHIKLSTTTGYFSAVIPTVSGAVITVKNSGGTEFIFSDTGNGDYVCNEFEPALGETYTLTISLNGQILVATESLMDVPPIDKIEQKTETGIGSEEDRIDVKTYFTDPGNTTDFYMTRYQTNINAIPTFHVTDDEFFQGNQVFDLYLNQDIRPGNFMEIKLYGISERYFNYMAILTAMAEGGGPFGTPPATLRGNVRNLTNPDDFILGYFSLSETDTRTYVVY
jgi:uncharacterized protein DUF4249